MKDSVTMMEDSKSTMEELFTDVEDFTDPTLMEYILERLEEIQTEDHEFMQILVSKQNTMVINWMQPWYQRSSGITRAINVSNTNEIDTFRTDTVCLEESKRIHKNWREFRKVYGVPNTPICLARWRNKEKSRNPTTPEEFVRRFVIAFVAQGLERNLYQVYKYFVTHYGSPNKGAYKQWEENVMAVCAYQSSRNAVPYLSAVLSREPRGIYNKLWQICNGKPDKKKIKWTLDLATKFLNLLMEYAGETSVENLKEKRFDKSIWSKLEGDIGQQYLYLQQFWYDTLHTQLFVKSDVKKNKLRRKVFKIIKLYSYQVWSDIRWKDIAKHFSSVFSRRFLYKLCHNLIHTYPGGYRKHPLVDVINYGIERSKSFRSKRLRTVILNEDKKLEVIRYENKMKY